jgi:3-deoxy-D-manno-octulosonate 8-phosphate phosphatase (KDO 8-P phosphatase)
MTQARSLTTTSLSVCPWPAEVLALARSVKVVFLDVDGVLTDGGLYISEAGESLKRFNTLDGHGLKLLQQVGIEPAVVTGRDSPALRHRLSTLGIVHARYGTTDKVPAAQAILDTLNLGWAQAAAMGDDWPDLPVLQRVALAVAPTNAHPEVLARAHVVTQKAGGHGAVRELCDGILRASGDYDRLLAQEGL